MSAEAGPCPVCTSSEQDYGPGSVCSTCGHYANPPACWDREEIARAAQVPVGRVHLRPGRDGRPIIDLHDYDRLTPESETAKDAAK